MAVGVCWVLFGLPIWLLDLATGGTLNPTSVFTHVGGPAVGILALRRLGWPAGVWWKASIAEAALLLLTRLVAPPERNINLVFAAFLAGFGVVGGIGGTERERYREPLRAIAKVAFGAFVPIYFGLVGYKLVFGREFSVGLLAAFVLGSTALSLITSGLAARVAGFRGLDIFNIALTLNARGGPGIVLASVAYDAGIINASFYTTLVLTAVVTSQMAGTWLRYVLGKGLPLLSTDANESWAPPVEPAVVEESAASAR